MKAIAVLFLGLLLAAGLLLGWVTPQDTQDPWPPQDSQSSQDPEDSGEPESTSPFPSFIASEKERLMKELEGAWTLLTFDTPEEIVDPEEFRGYAQFHDGYCTLIILGAEDVRDFFGSDTKYTAFAGGWRYRISESGTLQLSSVFGFDNLDDAGVFSFHVGPDATREYEIQLDTNSLRIHELGGDRFEFRRMGKSAFSDRALDSLRRQRNGGLFDDDVEDF